MHDPISALSNVMRSRATSSAGNALPGLNGFAIIGITPVSSIVSSIAYTASAPGANRGYGRSTMPLARYHANVMSSGAKIPFSASASAIMFAMVLRYAIRSC